MLELGPDASVANDAAGMPSGPQRRQVNFTPDVGAMAARYLGRDIDRYDFGSGLSRAREIIDIFTNAGLCFEPAKRVTKFALPRHDREFLPSQFLTKRWG